MDEVRIRTDKHIESEESNAGKREKETGKHGYAEQTGSQCPRSKPRRDRGNRSINRSTRPMADEAYIPLNAKLSTILDDSLHDGTKKGMLPSWE